MRPLMPPVQTPDNLFHDGNPLTGELGTIVDAEHLNNEQAAIRDTQSELIAILTAAAMEPESTAGQLLAALNKLYAPLNDTLGALSTLVGGANKLPYFTASNAAALTALSSIGRDIVGKATVADVLTYLGFVGSLTSPGYAVIPLGTKKLVIQWGTVTVPTAGSASATYLLALDLGLAQFCTPIDVSSINNYRVGVATSTKTSITLASTNTQSVTGVMWLSIGTIN
ncbi:hypothetical protein [Enterobacter roggenkampii]|uniref:hypothetical protein n=1 Tax=Enterobacter roggenkampii TaxID=1812935 RepID=UPI002FF4A8E1